MYGIPQTPPPFLINVDKRTKIEPWKRRDMRDALPKNFTGLSRPAFDKSGSQFMLGTEFQDEETNLQNRVILGRVEYNAEQEDNGQRWDALHITSYPINEHVRDVDWLDQTRIVVALNQKLGIVVLGENHALNEIVLFPDFHTDTIRELKVNPKDNHLVISGGFDGNVFVTDISRLVDDIQKNEKKSENSVYLCKDVVGSVCWHPNDHNVASCTTDLGVLHVFDIRTDQSKPAFVYDTGKIELYAHAYVDDFTVCLGYGDGIVQIHDIRNGKGMASMKDPSQNCIGDIQFAPNMITTPSGAKVKKMAVFGMPSMSLWQFSSSPSAIECNAYWGPTNPTKDFHVSGCWVPNSDLLLVSDSAGSIALYDSNAQAPTAMTSMLASGSTTMG